MKITPSVEPSILAEKVTKKLGIIIKEVKLFRHKHGILEVYFTWDANEKAQGGMKIGTYYGKTSAWDYKGYTIGFPAIKYRYNKKNTWDSLYEFRVILYGEKDKKFKYEPLFHQNYGYAASVYFAPENWNVGAKEIKF